jgi:NCAIR mutase (PurE)-related protein
MIEVVPDPGRKKRTGFPEVIYGESKSAPQLALAFQGVLQHSPTVLATRVSPEKADTVIESLRNLKKVRLHYHSQSQCLYSGKITRTLPGTLAVVAAGTSDLRVAEEATLTARLMGAHVKVWPDLGVAGLNRLLVRLPALRRADVIIAVAGMEAALASVLGGLVACPVIGLPTSVGYGTGAKGYAAMLAMLNTCAPGVTVVNIDNGFGAGFAAARILSQIKKCSSKKSSGREASPA